MYKLEDRSELQYRKLRRETGDAKLDRASTSK